MSDFFILGCSRSGTTMFASMLNNHPTVVLPSETWWLPIACDLGVSSFSGKHRYRAFMNRIKDNLSAGAGKEEWVPFVDSFVSRYSSFQGSYNTLFDLFVAHAKTHFGVTVFGEKTPAHTTFVRELQTNFPEYRKIVLLRDPRDIVCSYFNAWFDKSDESLYKVLKTLKCYLLNITHALKEYDCLQIKYEALTSSTAEEMERVCAFISIPFSEKVLELNPTASPAGVHKNLAKPIFSNIQKYRKTLPIHYIAAIQAVFADEMQMFGYSIDATGGEHRAFTDRYLPVIAEASEQVALATRLKDSRNWRPTLKSWLRAATINMKNMTR